MSTIARTYPPELIVAELRAFTDRSVARNGGSTKAVNPSHRVRFHWPPHPVSFAFHVRPNDWTDRSSFTEGDEVFEVEVAHTSHGVFGRCESIWLEGRGDTLEEMLEGMRDTSRPLFQRQTAIHRTLELEGRFTGNLSDLNALDLLKLLYCEDRDVAGEAHTIIDTQSSRREYFPGLLAILNDRQHPHRRTAQWCVLDLFEDLPTFCDGAEDEKSAVAAMRNLIWDAEDDYARTIYKAGVVLGGHLPYEYGGPTLLECLNSPSRIGRRAAIHGLFHVVEWVPEMEAQVLAALGQVAQSDPEPVLRAYAEAMARDIETQNMDHEPDPVFADES